MEIYTDPVTLPCGHSFCRDCITQTWDHQEHIRTHKCPECMKTYQRRPELKRNPRLHNIAEALREQEETEVFCTHCHSPVPAVKSCLTCEISMCYDHLRKHAKPVEHMLAAPIASLGKAVCPVHKKTLGYYCTQDSTCICATCHLAGEHIGHPVEPLDEASRKKKEKLRDILEKVTSEIQEAEKRAQSLKDHKRHVEDKTASVIVKVVTLISGIRRQLDELENKVLSEISKQEEQISKSVSNIIWQLEIEKNKMVQKMCQIQKLCDMTDPLSFLRDVDRGDICKETDKEREGACDEDNAVKDLDDGVILQTLFTDLSGILLGSDIWFSMQEPSDILLDINTAGNNVDIADDMKMACYSQNQEYLQTLERFECSQVMSVKNLSSGRHYWEVEVSSAGWWMVGVCYPSIDRRGISSWIGNNKKSWCLYRSNNVYCVVHDSRVTPLPQKSSCNRLRIHLDFEAGQLAFYEKRNPMIHLYTFTTTFTEPIRAAFSVCEDTVYHGNGWVKIISSLR
ncbi:unnamed protein product [Staurois parvus]|uniref:Uncharacterized protein n=1 Tax=Staurois parvus TaxID=386267 RepID=A0ABN9CBH6_9NEOB|nr:unnamed protein product [Staurois parvus]